MFFIQKVTQRYDMNQDRICLTAQDQQGQVMLIWLTQRLSNRLVGTLSSWLDEDFKSAPLTQVATTSGQEVAGLHVLEQQAAQAQLKPDQPVNVQQARRAVLPNRIDLARNRQNQLIYSLVFKNDDENQAYLQLNPTELRQWLGILYRVFEAAEWSKQAWPAWFNADMNKSPQVVRALH